MRAFTIVLILTLQTAILFSQETNGTESAAYFEHLLKNDDSCNRYNIYRLVRIYEKENKQVELKRTLERSIGCPLENFTQLSDYWQLADIYYNEGQYQKSLRMTRLAVASKSKVTTPHNPYPQVSNLSLALNLSRCYEALQQTDSSIYVLTPIVFYQYSYFEGLYDSVAYQKVLNKYLNLLQTKYSNQEIKAALGKASSGFYYYDIADKVADTFGCVHHKVDCGFSFLDYEIKYLDTYVIHCPNNISYDYLSKEFQYKYFKGTPLYNIIKML